MPHHVTRRTFIAGTAALTTAKLSLGDPPVRDTATTVQDHFPQQEPSVVREVVGVAHFDLKRVQALVDERPALANAAWDWGFGDWETPLGAASHVGHREIAEYLISKGARVDLFAATMLGRLKVVQALIESTPGIQRTRGPHGISLLAHARAGGKPAEAVAAYLATVDDAGLDETVATPDESAKARYLGTYRYGQGEGETVEILVDGQGRMEIKRFGGSARRLIPTGRDEFHPAGAKAVRVRFEARGKRAEKILVTDGTHVVSGTRL